MNSQDMQTQYASLERRVKTLLNADLKTICKSEGLTVTGVKASLQTRIIERLHDTMISGDRQRFQELGHKISPPNPMPPLDTSSHQQYQQQSSVPSLHQPHMHMAPGQQNPYGAGANGYTQKNRLQFTNSPFYSIIEPLNAPTDLPIMSSNRHTAHSRVRLTAPVVDRLKANDNIRILLYCTSDLQSPRKEVSFPSQIELKINSEPFRGSLKGIKKKAGTTRPADITGYIRNLATYDNSVSLSYAATTNVYTSEAKKYSFVVNLVQKHTIDELVDGIKRGRVITKQTIINEMIQKANDPDIVLSSSVMSLKCPLSTMRMSLPCRSTACNHNQCFDAASFLMVQEQAPQWTCPTCSKQFNFGDLVVDEYVQDILNKTPRSVEQVTVEPNGTWKPGVHTEEFRTSGAAKRKAGNAFEEDLVEIQDVRADSFKNSRMSTPQSFTRTPTTFSSREPSTATSSAARPPSSKKTSEVVDLTLDDEDENPLPRPIKRQSTSNGTPSFNAGSPLFPRAQSSNLYQSPFGVPLLQRPQPGLTQRPQSGYPQNHPLSYE